MYSAPLRIKLIPAQRGVAVKLLKRQGGWETDAVSVDIPLWPDREGRWRREHRLTAQVLESGTAISVIPRPINLPPVNREAVQDSLFG